MNDWSNTTLETKIGKIQLGETINTGNQAEVVLATNERGEKFAAKVVDISKIVIEDVIRINRLRREGRVLEHYNHPNTPTVYDWATGFKGDERISDVAYVLMEYIAGTRGSSIKVAEAPAKPLTSTIYSDEIEHAKRNLPPQNQKKGPYEAHKDTAFTTEDGLGNKPKTPTAYQIKIGEVELQRIAGIPEEDLETIDGSEQTKNESGIWFEEEDDEGQIVGKIYVTSEELNGAHTEPETTQLSETELNSLIFLEEGTRPEPQATPQEITPEFTAQQSAAQETIIYGEKERQEAEKTITIAEFVEHAKQYAETLQFYHTTSYKEANGVVHRDVKPDNMIFADSQGKPKSHLLDFGTARFVATEESDLNQFAVDEADEDEGTLDGGTLHGQIIGTKLFMAPEQLDSKNFKAPTPQMDTWGLGASLYKILTAQRPFEGEGAIFANSPKWIRRHRPDVSPHLEFLIHRCFTTQPTQRPTTTQLAYHFEQIQQKEAYVASSLTWREGKRKKLKEELGWQEHEHIEKTEQKIKEIIQTESELQIAGVTDAEIIVTQAAERADLDIEYFADDIAGYLNKYGMSGIQYWHETLNEDEKEEFEPIIDATNEAYLEATIDNLIPKLAATSTPEAISTRTKIDDLIQNYKDLIWLSLEGQDKGADRTFYMKKATDLIQIRCLLANKEELQKLQSELNDMRNQMHTEEKRIEHYRIRPQHKLFDSIAAQYNK